MFGYNEALLIPSQMRQGYLITFPSSVVVRMQHAWHATSGLHNCCERAHDVSRHSLQAQGPIGNCMPD